MLGSSAMVGMMIFILVLGLIGFLSCIGLLIESLKIVRYLFGRRIFLIALILVGAWFMKAGTWENNLEFKTVNKFMSSWKIASVNRMDSMAKTDMWGQMDFIRGRCQGYLIFHNDAYFLNKNSLSDYGKIVKLPSEKIYLADDLAGGYEEGMYKVKVFGTTADLYGENGIAYNVPLKFWVTGDNYEIVKMSFGETFN
jgi:hypothetical protein